jgi:hypothetical protein
VLDLQTLIDFVESEIVQIDMLFKKSNLPDFVDIKLVNKLIIKIRKKKYMVYKIILLSIVVFLVSSFTLFRKLSDKRIDKEDSKRINSIYQELVISMQIIQNL